MVTNIACRNDTQPSQALNMGVHIRWTDDFIVLASNEFILLSEQNSLLGKIPKTLSKLLFCGIRKGSQGIPAWNLYRSINSLLVKTTRLD